MRVLVITLLVCSTSLINAQDKKVWGKINFNPTPVYEFHPAVEIWKGNTLVGATLTDTVGEFFILVSDSNSKRAEDLNNYRFHIIDSIPSGTYDIIVRKNYQSPHGMIIRNEAITKSRNDTLNIDFRLRIGASIDSICPLDHSDEIVPMVYGLIQGDAYNDYRKKEEAGEIKLGGCKNAGQKWYCKRHRLRF